MRQAGIILMRSGFVAAIAFVVFKTSLATPWMSSWKDSWIEQCIVAAGGPIPFACFDCDPHGCEGRFASSFNTLPITLVLAVLAVGALLFTVGAISAQRRVRREGQL